ncbi:MAG: porin family protein [Saprospiraceae bacterium]|nr:porin family protein [Saprospiraceae bacterium]
MIYLLTIKNENMHLKIRLLLPLVAFALAGLSAQTEKGTYSVGLNYSPKIMIYQNSDNNRIEQHWELQGGNFIKRNWLLGAELSHTRFRSRYNGEIDHSTDTYRIGAFTRRYFDIKKTKWKPFIGMNAGFAYRNGKQQNPIAGEISFNKSGFYVNAEYGLAYFIKDRTSIHISNYVLYDVGDISISLLKFGITHNLSK